MYCGTTEWIRSLLVKLTIHGILWDTVNKWVVSTLAYAVADLGGAHGAAPLPPPPWRPNSFDFMQFSGKFGKIVSWRAPPPPPGKSWIRRCYAFSFHIKKERYWNVSTAEKFVEELLGRKPLKPSGNLDNAGGSQSIESSFLTSTK